MTKMTAQQVSALKAKICSNRRPLGRSPFNLVYYLRRSARPESACHRPMASTASRRPYTRLLRHWTQATPRRHSGPSHGQPQDSPEWPGCHGDGGPLQLLLERRRVVDAVEPAH